jgi:hypothetical protein
MARSHRVRKFVKSLPRFKQKSNNAVVSTVQLTKVSSPGESSNSLNAHSLDDPVVNDSSDSTSFGGDTPTSLSPTRQRLDSLSNFDRDRERSERRYKAAASLLREALEYRPERWKSLQLGDFDNLAENEVVSKFEEEIEKTLHPRGSENLTVSKTARKLMKRVFVVVSPFLKNFLLVVKEAQAVRVTSPFIAHGFSRCLP